MLTAVDIPFYLLFFENCRLLGLDSLLDLLASITVNFFVSVNTFIGERSNSNFTDISLNI